MIRQRRVVAHTQIGVNDNYYSVEERYIMDYIPGSSVTLIESTWETVASSLNKEQALKLLEGI